MGLFSRIFGGGEKESEVDFDHTAKQQELATLSEALSALTRRMHDDEFPVDNPGWQGRIRDLQRARAEADRLERTTFTRQDLFDYTTTVRVLYRGEPPAEYAALAQENDRVVRALDALMA